MEFMEQLPNDILLKNNKCTKITYGLNDFC